MSKIWYFLHSDLYVSDEHEPKKNSKIALTPMSHICASEVLDRNSWSKESFHILSLMNACLSSSEQCISYEPLKAKHL